VPVNLGKIGWEKEAKVVDGDQSFRSLVRRLVGAKGEVITCHPKWMRAMPPHARLVLNRIIKAGGHHVVHDPNLPLGRAHVHTPEK
jgi:hypothetical protein